MYTGVTGIKAEGEALGVVGDNISNTNTVGFKEQRALFEDVLGHSITAGSASAMPGSGVRMAGVQQMFTQGSVSNTGVATDLALSGDGFFVMKGTVDGVVGNFYGRNGQLKIDNQGYLVNSDGLNVQGYAALPNQTFAAGLSSIQVPTSAIAPYATLNMAVTANLNSNATPPVLAWDLQNPSATANFASSQSVFDSLGNQHSVDIYFRNTGPNAWTWYATAAGAEVAGGTPGQNSQIGTGTFTFGTDGSLATGGTGTITADFVNATAGQAITVDFGTDVAAGGTGLDGITQFAGASNVSSQTQDGYASGELAGITVSGTGIVDGMYTNGQKLAIGQLAIAKFRANEGLGRAGHNVWIETRESGAAAMGTAGSGGRGAIAAGAIEQSNVDLAQQFVDLIAHQRAFQANSKTITTADEMLQELENIKR
jgi:flagellar hook protein FlgE